MSGKVWNIFQRQAIDADNKSVVISAAAGSGKTSVLTERVLRLIEQGEDIERMLIVTFTNLAASEMRERIYRRIEDAGRQADTARLVAQAEKCAFADISTIHSFCIRVIRDNFEHAGVSLKFVVADNGQIRLMQERAMDLVMENAANDISMQKFISRYSSRGDTQGIKNVVQAIYNRVISTKHPYEWLENAKQNFEDEQFVYTLFESYQDMVTEAAERASVNLKHRSDIFRIKGFYQEADKSETERINMQKSVSAMTIDNVAIPIIAQINLPKVKGAPNRESMVYTNRANKCFESVSYCTGDFFAKINKELKDTAENGRIFIRLTNDFMKRYAKAKRAKNLLDHDDTIHFALKALSVPEIAKRYQDKFAHIFVDEYQDINDAQDAIIKLIQRDKNDFLVGDVKQCIYMFRESNPDLLKKRCRELSKSGLIEMNVNYRSERTIIDFINGVMCHMMTEDAGGVEYIGGQQLLAAKEGEGRVEIVLANNEEQDGLTSEGTEIARNIKKLVKDGYAYKDIAILRPEVSNSGKHLAKILSDMDIPIVRGFDSVNTSFSEISVYINLLSLIDGGVSDIALLSVMRYPHFGFTETDLAKIRIRQQTNKQHDDKSFFHAVRIFREDSALYEKVQKFLAEIAHYKKLSKALILPDFLMRLRQEAEFCEYAVTSAEGASSDNAITNFINTVSSMKIPGIKDVVEIADKVQSKNDITQSPGETNSVYITTIHKSKGLEFPVVILSGMHKRIEKRDAGGSVLIGRGLGLALDIIDETTRIKKSTIHKKAVVRNIKRETISEKVRLLYVGMTRAIERLVITGAGSEIKPRWLEDKFGGWQHDAATYFDLIIPAVNMACVKGNKDINDIVRIADNKSKSTNKTDKERRLEELFEKARLLEPEEIFIEYDKIADIGVPSKVSVSALKRQGELKVFKPVYYPSENSEVSAAERGTLMHKVLQKIGLEEKSEGAVRECVEQLGKEGLIDEELEKHVDVKVISKFLHSDLAARGRVSKRCFFEAPFCLRMSAKEAGTAESNERVIVQGVIDLCFVENGEWVVVDYKTDSVVADTVKIAAQKYNLQIALYCKALERITNMGVKEKYIYYLAINKKVQIP